MGELNTAETAVSEFEEKLHKLIKRAKKQRGMLWPSVVSRTSSSLAPMSAR